MTNYFTNLIIIMLSIILIRPIVNHSYHFIHNSSNIISRFASKGVGKGTVMVFGRFSGRFTGSNP